MLGSLKSPTEGTSSLEAENWSTLATKLVWTNNLFTNWNGLVGLFENIYLSKKLISFDQCIQIVNCFDFCNILTQRNLTYVYNRKIFNNFVYLDTQ